MNPPTVFISYSHKDEVWKDRLLPQLGVLRQRGILDYWDDRRIKGEYILENDELSRLLIL